MISFPHRVALAAVLAVVVLTGLVVRPLAGPAGDAAGSILYTVAVALVVALVRPRTAAGLAAGGAVCVSWLVEALQATGLAAAAARAFPPARLVLGTTFAWWDLAAYVVGGGVAYVLLRAVGRVGSSHGTPR
ncbi:DUF2809 domain-containing protein [Mariniluteicoccus flavus]